MSRPRPDFRRDFPQIESVFGYMIHRSDLNHNICIHALGYKLKCRRSQNIFFRKNIVWRTTIQEPVVHSRENIYWAFWSDRISALNRHCGASTVCSLSEDLLFFFNTISLNAKSSNLPFKLAATMAYFNLSPSTRSSAGIFLKENVCVCLHAHFQACVPAIAIWLSKQCRVFNVYEVNWERLLPATNNRTDKQGGQAFTFQTAVKKRAWSSWIVHPQ